MPCRKEPRDYVQILAPPGGSQRGLKIQARNETLCNPMYPSRQEVRENNYNRRLTQLTLEGFKSLNYKPYRGIGDPFYLKQKPLILHALGQWKEGEELTSSSTSEHEDEEEKMLEQFNKMQPMKTANFVLRRTRKGLHTLNKEIVHGREMIRNVSLGHGLFHLLKREKTQKADELLRKKREEKLRNEFQPARESSSSDSDSDGDVTADASNVSDASVVRVTASRSSTRSSRRNPHRPYTAPASIGKSGDGRRETIFRQLCALYWLLEAMNAETTSVMAPIITSWNFKDVASNKTRLMKQDSEKIESRWKMFLSGQSFRSTTRRTSSIRPILKMNRRPSTFQYGSTATLCSHAESQSEGSGGGAYPAVAPTIPEVGEMQSKKSSDTSYGRTDEKDASDDSRRSVGLAGHPSGHRSTVATATETVRPAPSSRKPAAMPYQEVLMPRATTAPVQRESGFRSRGTPRGIRSVRQRSSPAVLQCQATLNSVRVESMPLNMRQQFVEVEEEKSLMMHDTLEMIDRERIGKLQNKFLHMPTTENDFFRAVNSMRAKSLQLYLEKAKSRRQSSIHKPWYADLLTHVPDKMKQDWYIERILDKLSKYGMLQSRKQNVFRFLKTVEALRPWEVCAPDVCSAVEFCRERIVDMPVDEYDEWFRSRFPHVPRPRTAVAPPGGRSGKRGDANGAARAKSAAARATRK